jgi:hypothetical protein
VYDIWIVFVDLCVSFWDGGRVVLLVGKGGFEFVCAQRSRSRFYLDPNRSLLGSKYAGGVGFVCAGLV